ncbi:MAG: hypothetical protein AAB229_01270 [Candidatus Hydrogenedentota bacterium]
MNFWGVYREREHSPEREFDDAEILRLTGGRLADSGNLVDLFSPAELPSTAEENPDAIFVMCERRAILQQLQRWSKLGVIVINSPSAILNTYRERTLSLLGDAGISFPFSRIVSTADRVVPDETEFPAWVKRGDVHCVQSGDVVLARSRNEIERILAELHGRGIETAVVQQHIPGDLIKFYGVVDPDRSREDENWFRWFYHRDQVLAGFRFDESDLRASACLAARSLDLEIFGGDAIVTAAGETWIIDINAWPSFALFRDEASEQIAGHILRRAARSETLLVRTGGSDDKKIPAR